MSSLQLCGSLVQKLGTNTVLYESFDSATMKLEEVKVPGPAPRDPKPLTMYLAWMKIMLVKENRACLPKTPQPHGNPPPSVRQSSDTLTAERLCLLGRLRVCLKGYVRG